MESNFASARARICCARRVILHSSFGFELCRMSKLLGDVSLEGLAGRRAVLSYLSVSVISELESAVLVGGI